MVLCERPEHKTKNIALFFNFGDKKALKVTNSTRARMLRIIKTSFQIKQTSSKTKNLSGRIYLHLLLLVRHSSTSTSCVDLVQNFTITREYGSVTSIKSPENPESMLVLRMSPRYTLMLT